MSLQVLPFHRNCTGSDTFVIKNTPAILTSADIFSLNDAPCYWWFYDQEGPAKSTDTPVWCIPCPANATAANAAGSNRNWEGEMVFKKGISCRVTKDFASTGTTAVDASEVMLNGTYR